MKISDIIFIQTSDNNKTDYSYDNRGNLYLKTTKTFTATGTESTDVTSMGESTLYEYDGFNRLTDVTNGGSKANYEYNTAGIRTSKTVNGERIDFVLDGVNVIAEIRDGDVTNYVRGLTGLIYRKDKNGVKTYYVKNNHGDVTKLVNSSGVVIKSYNYNEFGIESNVDKTDTNPFRYCGEYYDNETGLIYLRARYYDMTIGRFISEDPARDELNWYAYCGGNPVNYCDPWGLEDIVVAGGAYHTNNGNSYQFEFVDSALKELKDNGGGTLLVADAGWTKKQRKAIVEAAKARGIKLMWFSSIESLTTYINEGDGNRAYDPITSFTVFAHGTTDDKDNYAITFGLYTGKDDDLRWYNKDILLINRSAFWNVSSTFYSCRTGNDFKNGNFAQMWADRTKGGTDAFRGSNGRTDYSNINGNIWDKPNPWYHDWYALQTSTCSGLDEKPGAAYNYPEADDDSQKTWFTPIC